MRTMRRAFHRPGGAAELGFKPAPLLLLLIIVTGAQQRHDVVDDAVVGVGA
jgi:hypothetical protein